MNLDAAAPPGRSAGGEAAAVVASTAASLSVAVPAHGQLRVALGMRPRSGAPAPLYYSGVGALVGAEVAPPVGVRGGVDFYSSEFNDWLLREDSRFDGMAATLDFILSSARARGSGLLPFVGLGGRLTHLTPRDLRVVPYPTWSLSLLAGVRLAGGIAIETRYPLIVPPGDPPAHFESSLGLWWGI